MIAKQNQKQESWDNLKNKKTSMPLTEEEIARIYFNDYTRYYNDEENDDIKEGDYNEQFSQYKIKYD